MIKQENMYLVAPAAMLDTPLPLETWEKVDENGVMLDPVEYHTVRSYVAQFGNTVDRFSLDGTLFMKGFNWTVHKIDEVRNKAGNFGLTYGTDLFILNHDEAMEMLATPAWTAPEPV